MNKCKQCEHYKWHAKEIGELASYHYCEIYGEVENGKIYSERCFEQKR